MVAYRKLFIIIIAFVFCNVTYAQTYSSILCQNQNFHCYIATHGDSWEKLFTNSQQRELIMKLNRVNIRIYRGMKIAIPKSNDRNILNYSPFPLKTDTQGTKTIFISLKALAWGAYDTNGELVNWGPVSGGKSYCPDTNRRCHTITGPFTIYNKAGQGCFSTKFPLGRGGAPMPYCMFFHRGFALHGSYEVPGYHASHGCVRMFVNDAKWLNQEFVANQLNVPVIIKGET